MRGGDRLFDPGTNRVMVVDFERSLFVQPPRSVTASAKQAYFGLQEPDKGTVTGVVQRRKYHCPDTKEDSVMANAA